MQEKITTKSTNGRPGPGYLEVITLTVLISLMTVTLAVGLYDQRYAQKVVAVDFKGFIQEQRDRLLAGEIDDNGLRAALDSLEVSLTSVPGNHVVILKEVVLRNAQDIELKP
ncbi:hypothetical protein ACHHRT_01640 [Desulfurivibrio sp. D14AmB]|uniref:hypothetical protein n=1 Tax=Desulfurivibrio sp. D14AmB TaxID=3374370 RepID=UPI00376F06D1